MLVGWVQRGRAEAAGKGGATRRTLAAGVDAAAGKGPRGGKVRVPQGRAGTVGKGQGRREGEGPIARKVFPADFDSSAIIDAAVQRRDVAQFGSAPALGAGCRRFESCRPDHILAGVVQW